MSIVYSIMRDKIFGYEFGHTFTTAQYIVHVKDTIVFLYRIVYKHMSILLAIGVGELLFE